MNLVDAFDTVYLVDLENVGPKPLCQHVEHHQDARYIIFYSDSTSGPGFILEQVSETLQVSFVNCKTGGNNAMDFCISAMAGKLAADVRKKVKILSNDKGYDPMICMLQEQGVRISREATYQPKPETTESQKTSQTPKDNLLLISTIRKNVPKQYQADVVNALSGTISRKEAHEMLQTILPQKMVPDIYKKLKKHIPKER